MSPGVALKPLAHNCSLSAVLGIRVVRSSVLIVHNGDWRALSLRCWVREHNLRQALTCRLAHPGSREPEDIAGLVGFLKIITCALSTQSMKRARLEPEIVVRRHFAGR